MGEDVGTPYPRKTLKLLLIRTQMHITYGLGMISDLLSKSTDSGESWEQESTRISPIEVILLLSPNRCWRSGANYNVFR